MPGNNKSVRKNKKTPGSRVKKKAICPKWSKYGKTKQICRAADRKSTF